jgi:hypothetical protein
LAATFLISGLASGPAALADDDRPHLRAGNLLLSRVIYDNNPNNIVAASALARSGIKCGSRLTSKIRAVNFIGSRRAPSSCRAYLADQRMARILGNAPLPH